MSFPHQTKKHTQVLPLNCNIFTTSHQNTELLPLNCNIFPTPHQKTELLPLIVVILPHTQQKNRFYHLTVIITTPHQKPYAVLLDCNSFTTPHQKTEVLPCKMIASKWNIKYLIFFLKLTIVYLVTMFTYEYYKNAIKQWLGVTLLFFVQHGWALPARFSLGT